MSFCRIRDLIDQEKPREKLKTRGVGVLTDVELLALVIRSGGKDASAIDIARKLVEHFGDLINISKADLEELLINKDIGPAKATSIKAAFEIGLRTVNKRKIKTVTIKKPEDVFWEMRKDIFGKDKEHLYLLSLDSRNKLISKDLISLGTINETIVSSREIFKKAFSRNAASIILVHNHPSNDCTASDEDIYMTKKVFEVGKKMGMPLVDHIIITDHTFSSLKALNLLDVQI